MADDMGWRDLSCYGNDRVSTPQIDRLAKQGIKLGVNVSKFLKFDSSGETPAKSADFSCLSCMGEMSHS